MRLEVESTVDRAVDEIYPLVRDDLTKLVPYLPDVEKIEVLKKERREDGKLEIINQWYSKPPSLPSLVKKFIKPEFFSWKDYAVWDDEKKLVNYRLEPIIGGRIFEAEGTNYFIDLGGNKTSIKVTCDIAIYPERLPGVPKLLANKVRSPIEGLIKKMLEPNLSSLAEGLRRYFQAQAQ